MSAYLLMPQKYLAALQSAMAKDSSISYRRLKADRSIALVYNRKTRDAMFMTAMAARTAPPDDYKEAFPWIMFAETRAENAANLLKYGWPEYDEV